MLIFLGLDPARREHLYCVRKDDLFLHCLTEGYHFSHYQQVLLSPSTRFVLFTARDDRSDLQHYVLDIVHGYIRTLDFSFEAYRVVKWITDQTILIVNQHGHAIADIAGCHVRCIEGLQHATTFDITTDERYIAMTTNHAPFTVSCWDRELNITTSIDLRDGDEGCWIESVTEWMPDEQFFGVLANYSELWLIAHDTTYGYKLAELEYFDLAYRWSPDGQWLSYYRALDHGGPGTLSGMICLIKRDTSEHRELATIADGAWAWLSDTEIVRLTHSNDVVVVDRIDVHTGEQTRLLSEDEAMTGFAFVGS